MDLAVSCSGATVSNDLLRLTIFDQESVISSRHLVGRLRNLLGNEEATEWESTFCLSKDLTAQ